MKLIGALIGAVIGGAIGAAVWAGIAYGTGYEIGWIAIGVGALAGIGAAAGAKGDTDFLTGAIAAVVAAGAICGGKYATIELLASKFAGGNQITISDDDAKIHLADQLVEEYQTQGKTLKWPAGQSVDTANEPAHYPKDLWKDCAARWDAMGPEAQTQYRDALQASSTAALNAAMSSIKGEAFLGSFEVLDIFFVLLAVVTAFQLGASGAAARGNS